MVVDEYAWGGGGDKGLLHVLHTAGRVVIETEYEVGNLEEHVTLLLVLVVAHDLLSIRQPQEEVGILIGNDDNGILAP